jgi:pilus assembly protein TadC
MEGLGQLIGTIAGAGPLTGGVWFIPFYLLFWVSNGYRLNLWWAISGFLAVVVISGTAIFILPRDLPNLLYIAVIPIVANLAFFIHAYKVNRSSGSN